MSTLAVIQLGAYRSLVYKFILFFSVNVKGCIHLAVRFLSNPHPQTAPKAEGPLSCSLYTIKVGIRQKVRNVQW